MGNLISDVAVVASLRENNPVKIRDIFDACAQDYDQDRPYLIPSFDLFYGTLLRQIPFPADAPIRVLHRWTRIEDDARAVRVEAVIDGRAQRITLFRQPTGAWSPLWH